MSKVKRAMFKFDGGSELDSIQEDIANGFEVSDATLKALQEAQGSNENWARPYFPLRDEHGDVVEPDQRPVARPSVYSKKLDAFSVARTPAY